MYLLSWKNPAFDVNKSTSIQVPVGSIVSDAASLRFTGKGAANYGSIQQENLMRLLENFADGVAPLYPTVGQIWYDTTNSIIRLCASTSPLVWKSIAGVQVTAIGEPAPMPAALGDLWFQRDGSASGFLYIYTGLGRFPVTGNAVYPATGASIGGWEQVYPTVSVAGGREEFDAVLSLVNKLIGPDGGNYAFGKSVSHLTNLGALDSSLRQKFLKFAPDSNVRSPAQNYVVTSSFEAGSQGSWNGSGAQPVAVQAWTKALATSARDTVESSTIINGTVGQTFYFKADLSAATSAPLSFGMEIHDAANHIVDWIKAVTIPAGQGWTRVSGFITIPFAQAAYFLPWIQIDAAPFQGGAAYATNLYIGQVDQGELKVDPTSQDWDMLLAAAKWGINRLEVPPNFAQDISAVPFVTDGRPPHPTLLTYPITDVRYPAPERRVNRKFGLITLVREFTETVNVLNSAIQNRYSLKGINGNTGTNATFDPSVQIFSQQSFSGAAGGLSSGNCGLAFRFTDAGSLISFVNSGAAVQVTLNHVVGGAGTVGDTNLKTLFDAQGVVRVTADKVRVFADVIPLTLSAAPISAGFQNAPPGGVLLATQSVAGASYTVTASISNGNQLNVTIAWVSTGAMNGTTTVEFATIRDTTVYLAPAPTLVFAAPAAYAAGDRYTSSYL